LDLIDAIDSELGSKGEHRLFSRIALSHCIRGVSIQRNHEWKSLRIKGWREMRVDDEYKDLIPLFKKKLLSNLLSVEEYNSKLVENGFFSKTGLSVHLEDSVMETKSGILPEEGVELVVTSPPYGDSTTTMAYEQFSWQTNVWLGLDRRPSGQLAKDMMGGTKPKVVEKLGHRAVDSSIGKMSGKLARRNFSFYRDYLRSIEEISDVVKEGGHACYIVGNRTSGGQNMRLDLFTRWAFERNGFKRVGRIKKRVIKNTKMPGAISINKASGIKTKVQTMGEEFVVVCRKTS
tara:strand:+ start:2227 stop:3096 length:870 start_codon:yes stop_codon:yes gene_type:complete